MCLVCGAFAFVIGLISGYPVGAKIVSEFREKGLVSKDEGERLLCFTNNSGPLFILSSVGIALFGDTKTGLLLLCTHILACISVGIIFGIISKKSRKNNLVGINSFKKSESYNDNSKFNSQKNINFKNLGEVLTNSINSSISTILMIGGFIVIFSVIISILNQTNILNKLSTIFYPLLKLFNFDIDFAKPLLSGIFELTNGINQVASINTKLISQNIVLSAFLLGFGGFSVLLQVYSIISKTDLSIKLYLKGKLLQGIIASIYTFFALKFLPFFNLDIIQANSLLYNPTNISNTNNIFVSSYSFFYSFGIFIITIILIFLILKIFNNLYLRIKDF